MITKSNFSAVTALALFVAIGVTDVACSTGTDTTTTPPVETQPPLARATDFELQDGLRTVWADHASLLHVYIVEAFAGLPDTNRALDRVLQNQTDIGNAVTPFYGLVYGETLTGFLRDRALIAGDVVNAAKAHEWAALETATARLIENGDRIAATIVAADPRIPVDVKALVRVGTDALLAQINARSDRQWQAATDAEALFLLHTRTLADVLAWSIAAKFPDRIAATELNPTAQQLYRDGRTMWHDRAFRTRVVVVETMGNVPDAYMALNELMLNTIELGDAVKPFYGPAEGSRLTLLLATHAITTVDYIAAAKGNDPAKTAALEGRLYSGANDIAALFAKANPGMESEYRTLWHRDVDHMVNQIEARLAHEWTNDLASYDESIHGMRNTADTVIANIIKGWPQAGVTIASQTGPQGPTAVQVLAPVNRLPQPNPPCTSCPYQGTLAPHH
jgi:hypothetical protein